jgi:hypothetical protein
MKEPNSVIIIGIVFLGLKNQEGGKVWISPKCFQAFNNAPSIEFEGFASNNNLVTLEGRMGGQRRVNNFIKLFSVLV